MYELLNFFVSEVNMKSNLFFLQGNNITGVCIAISNYSFEY